MIRKIKIEEFFFIDKWTALEFFFSTDKRRNVKMIKKETKFNGEEIVTYFKFVFILIKELNKLLFFFDFFKN